MSSATMQTINLNDKHGYRAMSVGLFLRLLLECMVIPTPCWITLRMKCRLKQTPVVPGSRARISRFQPEPASRLNKSASSCFALSLSPKIHSPSLFPLSRLTQRLQAMLGY